MSGLKGKSQHFRKGVTALSYALLVGLIGVVAIVSIDLAGDSAAGLLRRAADSMESTAQAAGSVDPGSPLTIDAAAGTTSFSSGPYSSVTVDVSGIDPADLLDGSSILGVTGTAPRYGNGDLSCGTPASAGMRCNNGAAEYLLFIGFQTSAGNCRTACETGGFNDPILEGDRTLLCQYDTVGTACFVSICSGVVGTDNGARSSMIGATCSRL